MLKDNFEELMAERTAALASLDMQYARTAMPDASGDSVRLIAMHKARYECTDLATDLRHESAAWLRARGYGRFGNLPLLPEGHLPEGSA